MQVGFVEVREIRGDERSLVTVHIARSSLLAVLCVVSSLEYRLRQFDVGN